MTTCPKSKELQRLCRQVQSLARERRSLNETELKIGGRNFLEWLAADKNRMAYLQIDEKLNPQKYQAFRTLRKQTTELEGLLGKYHQLTAESEECPTVYKAILFQLAEVYELWGNEEGAKIVREELGRTTPTILEAIAWALETEREYSH